MRLILFIFLLFFSTSSYAFLVDVPHETYTYNKSYSTTYPSSQDNIYGCSTLQSYTFSGTQNGSPWGNATTCENLKPAPDFNFSTYKFDSVYTPINCTTTPTVNVEGNPTGQLRLSYTKQTVENGICVFSCTEKTNEQCKIELNDPDAYFDASSCSCKLPCTPPEGKDFIRAYNSQSECQADLQNFETAYENLQCHGCLDSQNNWNGGLYGNEREIPCQELPEGSKFVDVSPSECNSENFKYSQPVTHGTYSPWYYGNFRYDSCRWLCVYEIEHCPANQAYGFDEGTCVTPPDNNSSCMGEFYCITAKVTESGESMCGRKCFCDGALVSDYPVSCSDQNSTNENEEDPNEEDEEDTSVDQNSTNNDTQAPGDCTETQIYNYTLEKCEERTDQNSTNPNEEDPNEEEGEDNNITKPTDTNNTTNGILEGIRSDLNTTNSILDQILQAIRADSNATNDTNTSAPPGTPGTDPEEEDDNKTEDKNDTKEGWDEDELKDAILNQFAKRYTIFNTDCGSPAFDPGVTFMGISVENPLPIMHEKISPYLEQIRILVILSATLLGVLSLFRR